MPPGELAKPALIVMAVGMLWVSFLPSTSDDAWAYIRILPGLLMIGAGMGIGFPSLNVGAMGAVTGQDLGLSASPAQRCDELGGVEIAVQADPLVALRGQAFLTRMDGEWWMGHHREPFA